jgi:hypothetical protein
MGLSAQPDTGDNGIHASASPFEGLAERLNWCGAQLETDTFGKKLLATGVPTETIMAYTQDPQVSFDGEMTSLFDLLEDTDADECCKKMFKAFKESDIQGSAKKKGDKRKSFLPPDVKVEQEVVKAAETGRKMSHLEVSLKFGSDEYDHKTFEAPAAGQEPSPQGCCIIA